MTTNPTLLGTGGHYGSGETYDPGTYYNNVGLGRSPMEGPGITDESRAYQVVRVPGAVSYLSWRLDETFRGTLTLTLNKNLSGTALAVSISGTGWVTDSTDSVSVVVGDELDFAATVTADDNVTYFGSFNCISARYDADSSTIAAQMLATVGPTTINGTSTTTEDYFSFLGILASPGDPMESNQQFYCLTGGTWKNMAFHVDGNTLYISETEHPSITVRNRINNGFGSMICNIPYMMWGYFEDASDSDDVSFGDLLDYQFVTNATSGSLTMDWIGAHFLTTQVSTSPPPCMIGGTPTSTHVIDAGTTTYSSLFGGGNPNISSVEPQTRDTGLFPYALTASNFTNYLTAADPQAAATFTLLKNGTAVLATSSTEGHLGYWIDTDTADFSSGDTCTNQIAATGISGTITWAGAGLLLAAVA